METNRAGAGRDSVFEELKIDRRAILGLAAGSALGGLGWCSAAGAASGTTVALWLADRDAQLVIGLDHRLLHRIVVAVSFPVALAPAADGGVWAVCALSGSRACAQYEWIRLDAEGQLLSRGELVGFLALRSGPDGAAWMLSGGGTKLVLRVGEGRATHRLDLDAALGIASDSKRRLIVIGREGELRQLEGARCSRAACIPELVLDAVAAERGWWLRTRTDVLALDEELSVRDCFPLAGETSGLIPARNRDGVWVLDRQGLSAELIVRSTRWRRRRSWSLAGVCRGLELESGGLLLATPGALLVLDRRGHPRAGQGGFAGLSDLTPAWTARSRPARG